jgi:hypothetical protein
MFSAILILVLLTEMVLYAVQVGVFEQRKSGNEMRQKQAFHAAETGIQNAQEFFLSNIKDLTFGGTDGWLADASSRWELCPTGLPEKGSHPCHGEPLTDLRANTYFYNFDDAETPDPTFVRILTDEILPNETETVSVQALLCLLDINRASSTPVEGCLLKDDPDVDDIYFVVTLLARGQAECDAAGDCAAEALIAKKVGSYGPLSGSGGPGVPLTTRSNFPPSGTAEIVPNPNGAGPGVPVSAWINNNWDCDTDPPADPLTPVSGSWATCEYHEWYGVHTMPDDFRCPSASCSCSSGEKRISFAESGDQVVGMDIIIDDDFPCDLWKYITKTEREDYESVKYSEPFTVIDDCSKLGPESSGAIWIDGSVETCAIAANTIVGSVDRPVFLIFAGDLLRLNGGAEIFGFILVTDVEGGDANFDVKGTNTVYGAVVVDGPIADYTGTFQIVYNDELIRLATQWGGLGNISGGWTDFHRDWR